MPTLMHRVRALALLAVAVAGAGACGDIISAPLTPFEVTIRDNSYSPSARVVLRGSRIRWINSGNSVHSVVSDENRFTSSSLANGDAFEYMFLQAGTFAYHCSFHPDMRGTVLVE
jgi:plastocyanin